jgi:hypothetical protein
MWNTIIGQIEKCEITTSDNFVRVKGHLSVESGGLNHIQNLISTFGGVISIVSWESKYGNVPMAFMSYTMNNSILGFHFSIIIDITPEMAQKQINAFDGNDLLKFKKCNLTLVDNAYFVTPLPSYYEAEKKSIVN